MAIKTSWDGFDGGPISADFYDDTELPPDVIAAQTVAEMVEAAAVMGFNLQITMKLGGEKVKITVESENGDVH